ncbi:hypothetical protein GmHk_12G034972 [Glycine max]|nr:hypothetical protein GmHk_12G034972 [Glycine max]
MAPPKEIATIIYHNGHIVDDPIQGSMYTPTTPIFFYVSRSITFTQFIRKINNHLPTRATEQVAQLLFCVPISFHLGQTRFISTQLFDNDDLRGAMETILQNPQLNSTEFYLPYNNIDHNNPVSSYNNLESQDPFDIYTSYTQILSENDSFFHGQQTSFDQQNHPSSLFTPPSQLPQMQTSNQDEHPIPNEDPIIRFHDENMDDFTENEDQQFFDHINHQSDDQTDDKGVGRPTTPSSPPLQYQQPRCPDTSHFFCMRYIAQNFLRSNSNCKHLKKPLMLAGENLFYLFVIIFFQSNFIT